MDLDSPILLEMQSDILLIISCLCETDMHRKVPEGAAGSFCIEHAKRPGNAPGGASSVWRRRYDFVLGNRECGAIAPMWIFFVRPPVSSRK